MALSCCKRVTTCYNIQHGSLKCSSPFWLREGNGVECGSWTQLRRQQVSGPRLREELLALLPIAPRFWLLFMQQEFGFWLTQTRFCIKKRHVWAPGVHCLTRKTTSLFWFDPPFYFECPFLFFVVAWTVCNSSVFCLISVSEQKTFHFQQHWQFIFITF